MFGGLLALFSAATFALNAVCVRRGVVTGTVMQALSVTVPIGVPITLVLVLVTGNVGTVFGLPLEPILWLAFAGVIHFCWGRYCSYKAMHAIGANLSAPVQQFALIIALGQAMFFLGEVLTPIKTLGLLLVIMGPMVLLRGRKKPAKETKPDAAIPVVSGGEDDDPSKLPGFQPRYVEGYIWAFLSTLGQGSSPVVVRIGMEGLSPAQGPAGVFISYLAATAVVVLIWLIPGQMRAVRSMERGNIKWFVLSGLFVGLSQTMRYMALTIAPVTVVTPIQRLSMVFRTLFSWVLNREHETFNIWVMLGIFISFLGAILLSIST